MTTQIAAAAPVLREAEEEAYADRVPPYTDAAIELIEVPQKSVGGKNSAAIAALDSPDLAAVVDALDQLIGAVAVLRDFVVDHRVVEPPDVSRRFPRPRVLDDRRVEADDRQRPAVRAVGRRDHDGAGGRRCRVVLGAAGDGEGEGGRSGDPSVRRGGAGSLRRR